MWGILAAAAAAWAALLIVRTISMRRMKRPVERPERIAPPEGYVDRLRRAVRFGTISLPEPTPDIIAEFDRFRAFLRESYPLCHARLVMEMDETFALLYRWDGGDPSLAPAVLLGHFDVVPAADESVWTRPPFEGYADGSYVWGRGTLDDKGCLLALFEAAEKLLSEGFTPARTMYIAVGGDEELSGKRGAARIARHLEDSGVRPEYILDEGSVIGDGVLAMADRPIAFIGTSEKGQMNVRLRAEGNGGHAALPPRHTAAGKLAAAVTKIERRPFPASMTPALRGFLEGIVPHTSVARSVLLANLWCFSPLLKLVLSRSAKTDALLRTTQAVTQLRGSDAPNVLPNTAEASVNVRILPGDSVDGVLRRYRKLTRRYGISVDVVDSSVPNEPVPLSPIDNPGYRAILGTISETFGDVGMTRYPVLMTTDSRHYRNLCPAIYRFVPMVLTSAEIDSIHGIDEKISYEVIEGCIDFYHRLLRRQA